MFSDLTAYTVMGERLDPEEIEEIVARIKAQAVQIVARHGGIVTQFRGDEVFALFGIPEAHDDDPVRAVRAARSLHAMIRGLSPEYEARTGFPLRFHTGISTGLIITSRRDERDGAIGVTGDAVNTGARLMNLAQADEILVSERSSRLVTDFFATIPLEPVKVKNKADPVTPYRIERETAAQTRFEAAERRGLTPFAGRQSELRELERSLGLVLQGQGQIVTVAGEAGIGKSRLVFEFRHGLNRHSLNIIEGRCQSYGSITPYMPWIDAMRRNLQIRHEENSEDAAEKVAEQIRALDPALERHVAQILSLLSLHSDQYQIPEELQGSGLREAFEAAITALVTTSATRRPLVLILEDWHWADEASESALRALRPLVSGFPLMVLVLHRLEREPSWPANTSVRSIVVPPLGVNDTARIIAAVMGVGKIPGELASLVQDRTGGNPFFTEEVSSSLVNRGQVLVQDRTVKLNQSVEVMDLPDTVHAVIRSRIDRLPATEKEVLRLASVIGREFTLAVLQKISSPKVQLRVILEKLSAQGLLHQVRTLPVAEYMFKHVLTQLVVYETLLRQQRRALHGSVGHALEAIYADQIEKYSEAIAHHYANSDEMDRAVKFLEMAGDKAAGVYSLTEAREHYRRAITLLDALDAQDLMQLRIDITCKLAKVSHYAINNAMLQDLETARGMAQTLNDASRAAKVLYWMGASYRMLGDHNRVFEVLTECRRLAVALGDRELEAFALHVMGRASFLTGGYAEGIELMRKGMEISELLGDVAEVSYSLGFSADCHAWCGEFQQAIDLAGRSLQLATESGDVSRQGGGNWYLAAVHCMRGDWRHGLAAAERCTELAHRIGGGYLIGAGLSAQGWATFMLDQPARGLALMEEGLHTMENSGSRQGTGLYASWLADCLAVAGRYAESKILAKKALDFKEAFGEGNGEAAAYRALAVAHSFEAVDGMIDPQWIDRSVQAAQQRGERPQLAITYFRWAEMLHRSGDIAQAEAMLGKAEELFLSMNMDWWLDQGTWLRKRLAARETFIAQVPFHRPASMI